MEAGKRTFQNAQGEWNVMFSVDVDLDGGTLDSNIETLVAARDELMADGFLPEVIYLDWSTESNYDVIDVAHTVYGIRPASTLEVKVRQRQDKDRAKTEAARLRERLAKLEEEL